MAEKVVVTGTGPAGLNAALTLSRKGFETVLVGGGKHCFEPELFTTGELSQLEVENLLAKTDVDFVEENVEAYRPVEKIVETSGDDITYDILVVAENGDVAEPDFSLEYTENFYSIEDREKALESLEDGKVSVIGSGLNGVRLGSELQSKGFDTALIDSSTRPLPEENESVSKRLLNFFNSNELSFRGGSTVKEVTSYGIEFMDDSELEIDQIIWCGGKEAPETVQESFECGSEGLEVNRGLSASGLDSVYAVGDSADLEDHSFHESVRQGVKVAENISSDSELLQEYRSRGINILRLGESGAVIKDDRMYINRLLKSYAVYRRFRYFARLRLKALRA